MYCLSTYQEVLKILEDIEHNENAESLTGMNTFEISIHISGEISMNNIKINDNV